MDTCDRCHRLVPWSDTTLVIGRESAHPDDDELLCSACMALDDEPMQ